MTDKKISTVRLIWEALTAPPPSAAKRAEYYERRDRRKREEEKDLIKEAISEVLDAR